MSRLWELARGYWFDAVVVVFLGVGLASTVVDYHTKSGPRGPLWFDILATVLMTTLLFARRQFPVGALYTIGVLIGASTFVDGRLMSDDFVAFLVGLAICVIFGTRPRLLPSLAGLAFAIAVAMIVVSNNPNRSGGDYVWNTVAFVVAWIVGFAVGGKGREAQEARERAARAEREREERALHAVSDERARIARELHDVVGHSVSVMTVQASAVRRLLEEDQDREREALVVVEQTGREALAEMRRLVGVLRPPEEAPALAPQPSLECLDRLAQQVREAGLRVDVRVEGDAVQLPASVDLTAYRLVQEGLTNALKHARAERAEVVVRYDDGHVEVTVSDDGRGGGDGEKGGHGLVGMRERVSVYGGELEAGPRPEGGFRLRARLPVTS
jgi:signal transduction histidine kinase